jgi:hypothetical protein
VLVVWEKALITDRSGPNTRAMRRISDSRVVQFWDKDRLLSHEMGESKSGKMVWDWVGVYRKGVVWNGTAPESYYSGGPVVDAAPELDGALGRALAK